MKNLFKIIFTFACIFAISCSGLAKNNIKGDKNMNLEELRKQDTVIDYFIQLAEIPSPSLKEDNVSNKIIELLTNAGIQTQKDDYGNVIARLDANNSDKDSLILSSHMDVVGSDDPVNIRISADGKYLETDKTRSLGSDDKAGGAVIIDILTYFKNHPEIPHPMIEATFTRDEENGMSGIKNLDTSKLNSRNALILDGSDVGECNIAGASFTNLNVAIIEGKSGHSGVDIGDNTRVSANKVLGEVISAIPQGVYKKDSTGVVTSINSGTVIGGSAGLYLLSNKKDLNIQTQEQIMNEIAEKSFRNIISANAYASYSIRSSEPKNEEKLKNEISKNLDKIAKKYEGKIKVVYTFNSHMPSFVKDYDEEFLNKVLNAAKKAGLNSKATSFHAAAETHVLQNYKKNAKNQTFKPMLLGVANILNMHSADERVDFESLIKGRDWVKEIILGL